MDAGNGGRVKASARNATSSTHQLESGSAALGNGTAVPFINQTTMQLQRPWMVMELHLTAVELHAITRLC
jgi:hypothetical protein